MLRSKVRSWTDINLTHHPFKNFSKDDVFVIQPWSSDGSDEELGTVGVFASIGHAEPARAVMLQLEVLVGETVSVDALAYIQKTKVTFFSISAALWLTGTRFFLISCAGESCTGCEGFKLTSSSISFGKVSTLDHEFRNDSVEFASLVTKPFLLKRNKHKQHLNVLDGCRLPLLHGWERREGV